MAEAKARDTVVIKSFYVCKIFWMHSHNLTYNVGFLPKYWYKCNILLLAT